MSTTAKRPRSEMETECAHSTTEPPSKRRKIDQEIADTAESWEGFDFGDGEEDIFDGDNDCNENSDDWGEAEDIPMVHSTMNPNEDSIDTSNITMNANSNRNHNHNTSTNSNSVTTTSATNQYTECWICLNCGAINRLLDTLTRYASRCAVCHSETYIPGKTDIIQSFEWDGNQSNTPMTTSPNGRSSLSSNQIAHPHGMIHVPGTDRYGRSRGQPLRSISNGNHRGNDYGNRYGNNRNRSQYVTKGQDNKEGDTLIMGLIRQNNVCIGNTIDIVPQDVIRLALLFHGEFEYDGWDTLTNTDDFKVNNGLTVCTRTLRNNGLWRNCFGIRELKGNGKEVRYEWILRCTSRQHQEWKEEPVDSIIVGVIEAKGAKMNMNAAYTQYSDGML